MNIFRRIEKSTERFDTQLDLKMGGFAQHRTTGFVGRITGVAEFDGDRKLTVELPNGKQLVQLSHREFFLANSAEFIAFAAQQRQAH